jgi:hypothetical protein
MNFSMIGDVAKIVEMISVSLGRSSKITIAIGAIPEGAAKSINKPDLVSLLITVLIDPDYRLYLFLKNDHITSLA